MTTAAIVAVLLGAAVLAATARLLWWQHRAPVAARSRGWRIAALIALQALVATLLHRTLFPPAAASSGATLVIATAGAPRLVAAGAGETLVALPEAGAVAGAARAPDLATALRDRGARAIRIVGEGLVSRDRPAARRVTVRFDPPAPPPGLVALEPPAPVAPGEAFRVVARLADGGRVELRDPAGRVVDAAAAAAEAPVALTGTARLPGTATFTLRWTARGASGTADVPVVTAAPTPVQVLIAAGAPGPEVKFLRRWASNAGLSPRTRVSVGGGTELGDPGAALTPAALARADAAIVDERVWAGLGAGGRAAVAQAVRGGLGLIVRVTAAVPRGWQALGLGLSGSGATVPLRLARAAPGEAALAARRGPGTRDAPATIAAPLGELPELTRLSAVPAGPGAVPLLRDARGATFAAWRGVGRGRVAVTTLLDSFALVTSGNGDRHADWWSRMVSTVGRGRDTADARVAALPRVGERAAICGLAGDSAVIDPAGNETPVLLDRSTGDCAGFWPGQPGWHRLAGRSGTPFFVHPADALPTLRAAERRAATLALVGERPVSAAAPAPTRPPPSWRWFLALLAAAGLLWWFERARFGRRAAAGGQSMS